MSALVSLDLVLTGEEYGFARGERISLVSRLREIYDGVAMGGEGLRGMPKFRSFDTKASQLASHACLTCPADPFS